MSCRFRHCLRMPVCLRLAFSASQYSISAHTGSVSFERSALRREFSYTNYEQTYILPDEVDREHISAKVEDGILTIALPKLAPEPEKKMDRTIEIG